MKSLLQKSAIPLISGLVLIAAVTLKLLGQTSATIGILGLSAMIVLLISSFNHVFPNADDEIQD